MAEIVFMLAEDDFRADRNALEAKLVMGALREIEPLLTAS